MVIKDYVAKEDRTNDESGDHEFKSDPYFEGLGWILFICGMMYWCFRLVTNY